MKKVSVRVSFIDPLLGTASADPEIHRKFIASKSPDADTLAEEVASIGVDEVVEKGMTVFPRDKDGNPVLWDYQIRGFFKEACQMLKRCGTGTKSSGLKAYKKEIDGTVFVRPRQILLQMPEGMGLAECQRPLRASTVQGERVALAHSEEAPEGTRIEFTVHLMNERLQNVLLEWLDYGEWHGMGQWRNSGKGRFLYTAYDENGTVLRTNGG